MILTYQRLSARSKEQITTETRSCYSGFRADLLFLHSHGSGESVCTVDKSEDKLGEIAPRYTSVRFEEFVD